MKNALFRRAAVGTIAAAAAVGLSTFFAAPASAHSAGPAGVATCGADGVYSVAWTVTNDYGKPVTLTNIKITPNGGTHADIPLPANGHDGFTTTYAGTTKAELILSVDGLWQDSPHTTWPENGQPKNFTSSKVTLAGTCKATVSSPSASPSPSPSKSPAKSPVPEASVSAPPSLPVTGSSNTVPMVSTGAALIAGGAGLVLTLRRRRRVTFTAE